MSCDILPDMTPLVILWVLCGGLAAIIAMLKGRSAGTFFLAGVLLGPIGLAWAAFADKAEDRDTNKLSSRNW